MAELSVALRIQAIVDGLASIGQLIDEIKELGGNSRNAGAQAENLGSELADLGKKQGVVDQFIRLKRELQETSQALEASRAHTGELAQELKTAENPSKSLSREFENTARATRELAEREQEHKLALQQMRVEMAAVGVASKHLARPQLDIKQAT